MPYTSTATSSMQLALDAVARGRAERLVRHVALGYDPPPRPAYVGLPPLPETVDAAYVLTGAARVGLNHWTLPSSPPARPVTFEPKPGAGVELVAVDLELDDIARAESLSEQLFVPVEAILSCAVCTGLAMLLGDAAIHGPFEV